MADIHVEKRNSMWPWILGLIVLALLLWALFEGFDRDRAVAPVGGVGVEEEIPVAVIVGQPETYRDQNVTGIATVAAVDAEGVWVEQDGQRLLVRVEPGVGQAYDPVAAGLGVGDTVRLTGIVREEAVGVGDPMSPTVAPDVYLAVEAEDIEPAGLE